MLPNMEKTIHAADLRLTDMAPNAKPRKHKGGILTYWPAASLMSGMSKTRMMIAFNSVPVNCQTKPDTNAEITNTANITMSLVRTLRRNLKMQAQPSPKHSVGL